MAVAAGAAASLPVTAAEAAVIVGSGGPITVAMDDRAGSVVWDVDGDGAPDFHIVNRDATDIEYLSISSVSLNGRGFVGNASDKPGVVELGFGAAVGPTLAVNTWGLADAVREVGAHTATYSSPARGFSWLTRVQQPVLVGFRFDSGAGLQYGWASMQLDFNGGQTALTIHQWAYESEPDTAVTAGQVDAPASGLAALTLVGLGAAGLRRHRRRKAQS
jgi:MYXO-CTERM domain-containing protein